MRHAKILVVKRVAFFMIFVQKERMLRLPARVRETGLLGRWSLYFTRSPKVTFFFVLTGGLPSLQVKCYAALSSTSIPPSAPSLNLSITLMLVVQWNI